MNTNIENDELIANKINKLRQLTDHASVSLINQIEELERVYGRQYCNKYFEPYINQLKISYEMLRLIQLVNKPSNGGTGSNESTSNGNLNLSVNRMSSTYLKEPTEKTMENGTEEYSATHVGNNCMNGPDPKSANVVVIRSSELQKRLESVAGPSGLQQPGTGLESQEMQVDQQNSSKSSMISSTRGSALYDDNEYEDSSNDELRNNHFANKSSEPQKKRKKFFAQNSTTDRNQVMAVSPVEPAADPNETWKNTDSSAYWGNITFRDQCKLCSRKQKNLSKHLSIEHPDAENYMSRPSSILADRMRRETTRLNHSLTGDWIGICGFCKKRLTSKQGWRDHFRLHTGEKLYSCNGCKVEFDTSKDHSKCKNGIVKNIYETFSNGAMKGFICDLCNFIQISEDRIKEHLRNEHKVTGIGEKYLHIDLILDGTQPDEMFQTNWEFIEERLRFKCGLDYCDFHADEIQALEAHLTSKHRKCVKTTCVHCNQLIRLQGNESMVEKYVNHLNLHGNDVYECSLCQTAYYEMKKIVKHLIDSHRSNDLSAGHFHREVKHTGVESIATGICIKFQCAICNIQLYNVDSIINHFETLHFGCNIDTSILILEKSRNQSKQQLTFDPSRWNLRQTIACYSCKTEPQSIEELADHCRNIHNSQNMDLKLTQLKLINFNECPSDQREFMFDRIFFACHHCINGIRPHELFANIKSVHEHWLKMHANVEIQKSFRFQVSEMAACYYCDSIGPYHSLKHHHVAKHDKLSFCISTIANKNKCALCQFVENSDSKLSDHFKEQHDEYQKIDVFSPLCLAEPILNKLLELNVHETFVCNHCQGIFDSSEIKHHNSAVHPGKKLNCVRAANNAKYQIECSFCHDFKGRDLDESIDHLLNFHKYEYKCVACPGIRSNDMILLVDHDIKHHREHIETAYKKRQKCFRKTILKGNFKSLAIFENGLTLPTNCLGGTRLDFITELTTGIDSKMNYIRKAFEASQRKQKTK